MSIPNDLSNYEKMANMKNIIGGSVMEILKQNIKTQQNENVIKMLELAKDKPETYIELLSVAIFHQNFEIIKYMVENFQITEADSPEINAISFYNSIFKDNSQNKLNLKENYSDIHCPFVIMCGIGGNIEIFNYLLSHKLISDKNQSGVIGLSKKLKNAFYSNIIGACSYYGKYQILEFLMKNYENEFDINYQTTEKKSKVNSRVSFSKEYSGFTPAMLAIAGFSSDLDTIEILKILKDYNAEFDKKDFKENNILHLATIYKKIETAKYLIDELKLDDLINQSNKEGKSPLSYAQYYNDNTFITYYSGKTGIDEKEVEKAIEELINESESKNKKSQKKKKNKKFKNNDISYATSEYQETLKIETEMPAKETNINDNNIIKSNRTTTTQSKLSNNNYNNSKKLHALLDEVGNKNKKKKEKQEINIDKEEKQKENNNKFKKETEEKEDKKEEEIKIIKKENEEEKDNNKKRKNIETSYESGIIGLGTKKNKKGKKGKGIIKNKDNENGKNNEDKEKEEKKIMEEEEEEKRKKEEEEEREREEKRKEEEKNKREEEERKRKEEEEEEKKRKKEEVERREEERKRKEEKRKR